MCSLMIRFPHNFYWGSAISSYQVEGNNINSDWWEWEKRIGLKETSGLACRHYEFFKEDFDLAKALNHNALRLSIEWSRIEPQEGKFSQEALKHYVEVINVLKQCNLEPVVTLHHFTNPLWFARLGGWRNKISNRYFLRYCKYIVETLCDKVHYWVTINEPLVYTYHAYILGIWPPQEKSFLMANLVAKNLANSHINAYRLIQSIYQKKNLFRPLVSIAKNLQAFIPCSPTLKNNLATYLRNRLFNFGFIERLIRCQTLDFIGINYYTPGLVDIQGWGLKNLLLDVCKSKHSELKKNSLGWNIYPQGLYQLLIKLKKYNLPIFILENGICTEDDNTRWEFIFGHLKNVHQAINEGGKSHWVSLLVAVR